MNRTQVAGTHFNRATDCFQHGRYAEAIRHYRTGLEIEATRAEIYADLSKSYEMVGRWDDALDCLNRALELSPDHPTVLRRRERIQEEKQVYEALLHGCDLDPEPPEDLLLESTDTGSCPRIRRERFVLECDDTISLNTSWSLCQLIEQTSRELGELLQCYPTREVSVVLEDIELHDDVEIQEHIPANSTFSLSGVSDYGGHIRLTTSIYEEPNPGLLLALIRHEWVHLLVDILAHRRCPVWFNEGLAQILARPLMEFERTRLRRAYHKCQFLRIDELQQQFGNMPPDRRKLAYLQSTGFMEYLIHRNGFSRIYDFLRFIGNGVTPDVAFQHFFDGTHETIMDKWKEVIDRGETRYRDCRARDLGRRQVFPSWLYA